MRRRGGRSCRVGDGIRRWGEWCWGDVERGRGIGEGIGREWMDERVGGRSCNVDMYIGGENGMGWCT